MSSQRTPRISVFSSLPSTPSSSSMLSWLPWNNAKYSALPRSNVPETYSPRPATAKRKLMLVGAGSFALLALIGILGGSDQVRSRITSSGSGDRTVTVYMNDPVEDPHWGMTESQGWQPHNVQLADLGDIAEERIILGFSPDEEGRRVYFQRLHEFASKFDLTIAEPMLYSLYKHLPPNSKHILTQPKEVNLGPPSMISYKTIHQTDKTDVMNNDMKEWIRVNEPDGWELNFMNDADAWAWVKEVFPDTDVEWAWGYMHRGVLRADFLRYLLPLVHGGVYSDVDTRPLRPIEQWGMVNVETLDLSETDGPEWRSQQSTHPAVVVAIDVNVHKKLDWWRGWPRAVDICQWTLSSAPNHPIFIDAARKVVNSTRFVEQWDLDRAARIAELQSTQPDGWQSEVQDLQSQKKDHALTVMEWTGPGLFSDAVLGFLLARYNVSWHRLRGLNHPLRIGDVLVLPITAFSPFGEADFHSEGMDSPQADVVHNFRGSWKPDGQR